MTERFVALLRGINVGGKNTIRMPALVAAFAEAGYSDVTTYIQSGNVLFSASSAAKLEPKLEKVILEAFGLAVPVIVRSRGELAATIAAAPDGFGTRPDEYRYDVIFLKHPLTSHAARAALPALADGVDAVSAGPGALYASRLTAQASRSRLRKVSGTPMYPQISIRNWNTTTKLLALLG